MTTRRPLSSPATPATRPVVQTRWAASVVASSCKQPSCRRPDRGIEAGENHLEIRVWRPGDVRPQRFDLCADCTRAMREGVGVQWEDAG